MKQTFNETLYPEYRQSFDIERVLYEVKTDHQHLVIFENARFGRVLALDGVIQSTEKDEFFYHEMLTHVPLIAHPNPKDVLIIGGGDGGILREVLKHPCVESVTMVEIDQAVIDMSVEYLPKHSNGAFDDPRVTVIIDDGAEFVKRCDKTFDVVISDSTDPIGPGEVLFTSPFYEGIKACTNEGGIFAAQNGVPFMQLEELTTTKKRLSTYYTDTSFYFTPVPTYIGGLMALAWGSDEATYRHLALETLQTRFAERKLVTRYYTPEIHRGSLALPQYIINAIQA